MVQSKTQASRSLLTGSTMTNSMAMTSASKNDQTSQLGNNFMKLLGKAGGNRKLNRTKQSTLSPGPIGEQNSRERATSHMHNGKTQQPISPKASRMSSKNIKRESSERRVKRNFGGGLWKEDKS